MQFSGLQIFNNTPIQFIPVHHIYLAIYPKVSN